MIRLKLTMTKNAQSRRKFLSAKNLDSKYLRVNKLRVQDCASGGKGLSAPGLDELAVSRRDDVF